MLAGQRGWYQAGNEAPIAIAARQDFSPLGACLKISLDVRQDAGEHACLGAGSSSVSLVPFC